MLMRGIQFFLGSKFTGLGFLKSLEIFILDMYSLNPSQRRDVNVLKKIHRPQFIGLELANLGLEALPRHHGSESMYNFSSGH